MLRLLPVLVSLLAIGGVAAGCDSDDSGTDARAEAQQRSHLFGEKLLSLNGAPAPLAELHEQANELLDGGPQAFERRLRRLRGYPVVVNKWGSWCGSCRDELPYFQRQSLKHGKRIAFLGVDAAEYGGYDEAAEVLAEVPVAYPSYKDQDLKISALFNGVVATPATAFYDSNGELAYLKQGAYLDEQDLAEDIEHYARTAPPAADAHGHRPIRAARRSGRGAGLRRSQARSRR